MTWLRVDDKLHAHPKWWACSPNAKALWTTAASWSASYKTDGLILDRQIPMIAPQVGLSTRATRVAAVELVTAGLWTLTDGGWLYHNWIEFNPLRATLDKDAAVEKERKKIQNDPDLKSAIRLRDRDLCRYCGVRVNFAARTGTNAGRYDHIIPVSKGGKTTIDNVVVCCDFDNRRKYNKTLDQAELTLLDPGTSATAGEDLLRNGSVQTKAKSEPRLGSGLGQGLAATSAGSDQPATSSVSDRGLYVVPDLVGECPPPTDDDYPVGLYS